MRCLEKDSEVQLTLKQCEAIFVQLVSMCRIFYGSLCRGIRSSGDFMSIKENYALGF